MWFRRLFVVAAALALISLIGGEAQSHPFEQSPSILDHLRRWEGVMVIDMKSASPRLAVVYTDQLRLNRSALRSARSLSAEETEFGYGYKVTLPDLGCVEGDLIRHRGTHYRVILIRNPHDVTALVGQWETDLTRGARLTEGLIVPAERQNIPTTCAAGVCGQIWTLSTWPTDVCAPPKGTETEEREDA